MIQNIEAYALRAEAPNSVSCTGWSPDMCQELPQRTISCAHFPQNDICQRENKRGQKQNLYLKKEKFQVQVLHTSVVNAYNK